MKRTTTEKGLGHTHQQARSAALARLQPGEPCELCGAPMWPDDQAIDLDHVLARVLGGQNGETRLVHASCNRSRGAAMGNRLRGARRAPPARAGWYSPQGHGPCSQQWCADYVYVPARG